jgi:hypothetical protein
MGRGASSIAELVEPRRRARPQSGQRTGLTQEAEQLKRTLHHFEQLLGLAAEERDPVWKQRVEGLAWQYVRDAEPIRILHAGQLLDVSDRTIAEWIRRGVLEGRPGRPQRLTLESALRVKEAVDELRRLGRDRDLLSAVLNRLELEDLGGDDRYQRSLEQMRQGKRGEWPKRWAGKV